MGDQIHEVSPAPQRPGPSTRQILAVALTALPLAGLVWVPSFARTEPTLASVPFFYWYQLAWVLGSLLCLLSAHRLARVPEPHRPGSPPGKPSS